MGIDISYVSEAAWLGLDLGFVFRVRFSIRIVLGFCVRVIRISARCELR